MLESTHDKQFSYNLKRWANSPQPTKRAQGAEIESIQRVPIAAPVVKNDYSFVYEEEGRNGGVIEEQ